RLWWLPLSHRWYCFQFSCCMPFQVLSQHSVQLSTLSSNMWSVIPNVILIAKSLNRQIQAQKLIRKRLKIPQPIKKPANDSGSVKKILQSARRRSEEHTSELQSREKLVCRLLLEK